MLATAVVPGRFTPATDVIRTPDQRLRVFVSSTMRELAAERRAVRNAVTRLRLVPVMFELGARPHPARQLYRAYLAQSQVFVGVYWQSYGWVPPGETISGLEDEYRLSAGLPRLIYVKAPASDREPRLAEMLGRIRDDADVSYQHFSNAAELQRLVENDLAVLLSERFEMTLPHRGAAADETAPSGMLPVPSTRIAAGPQAGALPTPPTPLVGREDDVAAVRDLVTTHGARLVTLTGPGGVGKTRLAVAAAGQLAPGFAEGVRFVQLASVPSADLVPGAIAAGLGLNSLGDRLIADLESYLRPRRLVLVLDNFEQVTGAAPLVTDLLAAAPELVVLVTSRSVLRLSGEHEFPVLPLPVPPAGARLDDADPRQCASVQLFVERARAVIPSFKLTSANAEAVAEIARRLDGLPLAIELAAARVRLLPPPALLARLDDRMRLLTDGARDLPERQRTLRNTLDWSFALLSPGEQALFARLGVFAGPFGLPAAEAICGSDADIGEGRVAAAAEACRGADVVDTLGSLVDSSLVRPQTRDGKTRFMLLDTIREYALEKLRDRGDWKEAHDRHAAYYRALAEPAESELHGAGQLAWLNRLEIRHENVGAALSWLVDSGQGGSAVDLIWATWRFWWLHGHSEELGQYVAKILARSEAMSPHEHAMALSGGGYTLLAGADPRGARSLFEQSLPLLRQTGDTLRTALAAATLGNVLVRLGEPARAAEVLEQTLGELREADTGELTEHERLLYLLSATLVDNFLGQMQLAAGDHDRAARLFANGLSTARDAQDRVTIIVSLYDLALSSQARGDLAGATGLLKEGLSLAAEAGDQPSVAYYLEALASVAGLGDDPERAVCLLAAAAEGLQTNGSGWLHAYVPRAPHDDRALAALRARLGDAAFEEAWARGRSLGGTRSVPYALDVEGPASA